MIRYKSIYMFKLIHRSSPPTFLVYHVIAADYCTYAVLLLSFPRAWARGPSLPRGSGGRVGRQLPRYEGSAPQV